MGSNDGGRRPWGIIGITILLSLVGPIVLVNLLLGDTTPIKRAVANIGFSTATVEPRRTSTASPSPTVTSIPSVPSATATPTIAAPGSDFAGAYVEGVTWLEDGRTMVRTIVPAGAAGNYRAEVETNRTHAYVCVIPEDHEDRIYCVGPQLARGITAIIRVYHSASAERLVFESEFVAAEVLPTPTPMATSGADGESLSTSTSTPTPTLTLSLTPSPSTTSTWTPTPTATRTPTPTPSSTSPISLSPTPTPTNSSTPPPSATPIPTNTPTGSVPTETPIPPSATLEPTSTAPVPTDTPLAPSSTPVPPSETPEKCMGPGHPQFPCTETPAPDPPTTAPEPTEPPIPTP